MSRLIDADEFESYLINRYSGNDTGDEIIEDLTHQPTVDAVERKRGRWEMKPDPYGFFDEIPVCSECGCTTKMRETYKFCPNCGADMRGENNG